jgi:hypothetical protein
MAEYKEPKFVKWIMEGDKRSCDRLIGTAQQFLNTIRGMNKGGFNVPIIRRTLADGSEITAKTHLPGVDIVTIRAQVTAKAGKKITLQDLILCYRVWKIVERDGKLVRVNGWIQASESTLEPISIFFEKGVETLIGGSSLYTDNITIEDWVNSTDEPVTYGGYCPCGDDESGFDDGWSNTKHDSSSAEQKIKEKTLIYEKKDGNLLFTEDDSYLYDHSNTYLLDAVYPCGYPHSYNLNQTDVWTTNDLIFKQTQLFLYAGYMRYSCVNPWNPNQWYAYYSRTNQNRTYHIHTHIDLMGYIDHWALICWGWGVWECEYNWSTTRDHTTYIATINISGTEIPFDLIGINNYDRDEYVVGGSRVETHPPCTETYQDEIREHSISFGREYEYLKAQLRTVTESEYYNPDKSVILGGYWTSGIEYKKLTINRVEIENTSEWLGKYYNWYGGPTVFKVDGNDLVQKTWDANYLEKYYADRPTWIIPDTTGEYYKTGFVLTYVLKAIQEIEEPY